MEGLAAALQGTLSADDRERNGASQVLSQWVQTTDACAVFAALLQLSSNNSDMALSLAAALFLKSNARAVLAAASTDVQAAAGIEVCKTVQTLAAGRSQPTLVRQLCTLLAEVPSLHGAVPALFSALVADERTRQTGWALVAACAHASMPLCRHVWRESAASAPQLLLPDFERQRGGMPGSDIHEALEALLSAGLGKDMRSADEAGKALHQTAGTYLGLFLDAPSPVSFRLLATGAGCLDGRLPEERALQEKVVAGVGRYYEEGATAGGDLSELTSAVAMVYRGYLKGLVSYKAGGRVLKADAVLVSVFEFFLAHCEDAVALEGLQLLCKYVGDVCGDAEGTASIFTAAFALLEGASLLPSASGEDAGAKAQKLHLVASLCDGLSGVLAGQCLRKTQTGLLPALMQAAQQYFEGLLSGQMRGGPCATEFTEALFDAMQAVVQRFAHGLNESEAFAKPLMECLGASADLFLNAKGHLSKETAIRVPHCNYLFRKAEHLINLLCKELSTDETYTVVEHRMPHFCAVLKDLLGHDGSPAACIERLTACDSVLLSLFVLVSSTLGFHSRFFGDEARPLLASTAAAVGAISNLFKASGGTPPQEGCDVLSSVLELSASVIVVCLEVGEHGVSDVAAGLVENCGNCLLSDSYWLKKGGFVFMSRVVMVYGDRCVGVVGKVLDVAADLLGRSEQSDCNTEVREVEACALEFMGDAAGGVDSFDPFLAKALPALLAVAGRHPHVQLKAAALYALERIVLAHCDAASPCLPGIVDAAVLALNCPEETAPHAASAVLCSALMEFVPVTHQNYRQLKERASVFDDALTTGVVVQ